MSTVIAKHKCLTCEREYLPAEGTKLCPVDGTLLAAVTTDTLIGSIWAGKYEIEELVGAGGFGKIYKAVHLELNKVVAIKILQSDCLKDPKNLSRFQTEARVLIGLIHPNIVSVFDHGIAPQPYIVMEYIDGPTLEQKIEQDGILEVEEFLVIFQQIADAMSVAHKAGLLHRDIKPSNIMMDRRSGLAKILDFGVVKVTGQDHTQTGEVLGSPPYMSPEQCMGQPLDERCDIYSLGCVMYESLAAVKPFAGETAVDCMYKHFNGLLEPLSEARKKADLPKSLDYVISRSLADIDDRYKTMEALRSDLEKVQSGITIFRLRKVRRVTYKKVITVAARISAVGNWTIISLLFLVYLPFLVSYLWEVYQWL